MSKLFAVPAGNGMVEIHEVVKSTVVMTVAEKDAQKAIQLLGGTFIPKKRAGRPPGSTNGPKNVPANGRRKGRKKPGPKPGSKRRKKGPGQGRKTGGTPQIDANLPVIDITARQDEKPPYNATDVSLAVGH